MRESSVLLGMLVDPVRMPLVPLTAVGAISTLDSRWFAAFILASVCAPFVMGLGRTISSIVFLRGVLASYLSSPRYRCTELKVATQNLVDRFRLWSADVYNLSPQERDRRAVRFFLVEGTDLDADCSVSAKCFAGDSQRPAVVFLRNAPTTDHFALFEFTHELGHASLEANDTEALRYVEPIFVCLSAFAFLCSALRSLRAGREKHLA
jgi:hypothetical protein